MQSLWYKVLDIIIYSLIIVFMLYTLSTVLYNRKLIDDIINKHEDIEKILKENHDKLHSIEDALKKNNSLPLDK